MNKQEIFDKMVSHLLTQKKKSMVTVTEGPSAGTKICAYRGEGGLRCTVGCLITDEAYSVTLENEPAARVEVMEALVKSGVLTYPIDKDVISMISRLQRIHDNRTPSDWYTLLLVEASAHGLETSVFNPFRTSRTVH